MTLGRWRPLVSIAALLVPASAPAWTTRLSIVPPTLSVANHVTVDPSNDVVACGVVTAPGTANDGDFVVAKLAGSTGAEVWRYVLDGSDPEDEPLSPKTESAYGVATDGMGDVFVVGVLANAATFQDAAVVKLRGSDGAELWRAVLDGPHLQYDSPAGLAVGTGGDLFTVLRSFGRDDGPAPGQSIAVLRLEGASGAVAWRQDVAETDSGGFALDAAGDVVVGESSSEDPHPVRIRKLAGADGAARWLHTVAGAAGTPTVTVDAQGGVLVGTTTSVVIPQALVVSLAGAGGAERWRREIRTESSSRSPSLLALRAGDVFASTDGGVGRLAGDSGELLWFRPTRFLLFSEALGAGDDVIVTGSKRRGFHVAALAGATGRTRWQRTLARGTATNSSVAISATVDAAGDVVAAGGLKTLAPRPAEHTPNFGVVKLCGRTGKAHATRCPH